MISSGGADVFSPSRREEPLTAQEAVERYLADPAEDRCTELFWHIAPRVSSYFRVRGCGRDLSEDLTQEVMLSVFRQTSTLRHKELFLAWLYRIARNVLMQHLRKENRQLTGISLSPDAEEPWSRHPDPLLPAQFAEWMAFLDPDERQILTLRYVEELDYIEIAGVLDLPLGTVQWKIFRSKKKLAARFGPQAG